MMPPELARARSGAGMRLLAAAVRSAWDASARASVAELVRAPLRWDALLGKARLHGLTLFVHRACGAAAHVPPDVRGRLHAQARAAAARACVLTAELLNVIGELERRGIPALAVKGPALGALLYGKESCRQFGDLDLLVPRRDFAAACELVRAQGYRPYFPLPDDPAALFARCEHAFVRPRGDVHIDLHCALLDEYFGAARDSASLWDRSVSVALGGGRARTPAPADAMLHLCVHGAGHNWRRLDWPADVAALGRLLSEREWFDLMARAERLGARRMLLLGIRVAAWTYGLEAPRAIERVLDAERTATALAVRACRLLFDEDAAPARQSPGYFLRALDRTGDRARLLWKRMSTPPAWVRRRASPGAAHVLRPLQLLGRYAIPRR